MWFIGYNNKSFVLSVISSDFLVLVPTGVDSAIRQMGNDAKPTIVISHEGDKVVLKTLSSVISTEISFKLGEEFDETTADDRQVKVCVFSSTESTAYLTSVS